MTYSRQSRLDSGLDFQVKVLGTLQVAPHQEPPSVEGSCFTPSDSRAQTYLVCPSRPTRIEVHNLINKQEKLTTRLMSKKQYKSNTFRRFNVLYDLPNFTRRELEPERWRLCERDTGRGHPGAPRSSPPPHLRPPPCQCTCNHRGTSLISNTHPPRTTVGP